MAAEKSPAFQFYAKEFLTDGNVAAMSLAERGAYITLLCICWQEGSLPSDLTRLARIVGTPLSAFKKIWPALQVCFRPHPSDSTRLIQGRLEREREKQRLFLQRATAGGRARASSAARDERGHLLSDPASEPATSQLNSQLSDQQDSQLKDQPSSRSPISDFRTSVIPPVVPLLGGRVTKTEFKEAKAVRDRALGHCPHEPKCDTYTECVRAIALERRNH